MLPRKLLKSVVHPHLLFLPLLFVPTMSYAQRLLHTFEDPTPSSRQEFGDVVALSGKHVVIGSGRNAREVHVFDAVSGDFSLTLKNPEPGDSDGFGRSVAVDRDFALVGASRADESGLVHLYDATTGELLDTLDDPTPMGNDRFGTQVSIHGDLVAISERHETGDLFDSNSGRVSLFDLGTRNLVHAFDDPTPTQSDNFTKLVLHGNRLLVGANDDDTLGEDVGQAHLFDANTGSLLHTLNDPFPHDGDGFGQSIALYGDHALVADRNLPLEDSAPGAAHLFDAETGELLHSLVDPTPSSGDFFGTSVAIDAQHAIVGEVRQEAEGVFGEAHLFNLSTGELVKTINNPAGALDGFGWSVDLENNLALVSAREGDGGRQESGIVYLFDLDMPTARLGDFNDDGMLTAIDIDLLSAEILVASPETTFDLDGDGSVTATDRQTWVTSAEFADTFFGDADLNGEVDFGDFLVLSEHFGQSVGWADGNFDGLGTVDFSDFLSLSSNFGNSRMAAQSVPESNTLELAAIVSGLCMLRWRDRR